MLFSAATGAGWIREIFESLNLVNEAADDSVHSKQTELQLRKWKKNDINLNQQKLCASTVLWN